MHALEQTAAPKSDAATVQEIAAETDTNADQVKVLLDEEMAELFAGSKVKNYIRLIAGRRVKQLLTQTKSAL